MVLPSQTARTTYRRSHTFRSRAMSAKLIGGGIAFAVVAIIVWVVVARNGDGDNAPPAVATTDAAKDESASKPTTANAPKSAPATSLAQQPQRNTPPTNTRADDAPRIVMGADVPKLPMQQPGANTAGSNQASPGALSQRSDSPAVSEPPAQPTRTQPTEQPAASRQAPQGPATQPPADQSPRAVTHAQRLIDEGVRQAAAGQLVAARQTLSMALEQLDPYGRDAELARKKLTEINETLVFSEKVAPNDPFAKAHKIQPGEMLSAIAKPLGIDWKFIARINGIKDPSKIQAGQTVKVITGKFHAVVRKAAYELDLYLGDGSDRVYVRSFKVGLGELDSTPLGRFAVASRVPNPDWKNPRTGEYFDRNDPKNPIGEFWVGLKGIEEKTRGMTGYGVHGTVDLDSIGKQASMGCVRMLPDDIALVYELLVTDLNTVEIVP